MTTYTSGRPRVHRTGTDQQLLNTIAEYEQYVADNQDDLARHLSAVAADLSEELLLRVTERELGIHR